MLTMPAENETSGALTQAAPEVHYSVGQATLRLSWPTAIVGGSGTLSGFALAAARLPHVATTESTGPSAKTQSRSIVLRAFELTLGEFRVSAWRTARTVIRRKNVVVGRRFQVKGLGRIETRQGRLMLGTRFYGFADPRMGGLLRVRGSLQIKGIVTIAHGNRWDIGPMAVVSINDGSYFSPMTKVVISSGLTVGKDCGIAWDCQLLDDDQHPLAQLGAASPPTAAAIDIGDHVWIASRVTILKGTRIGDGCVIASGATVRGDFSESGCLIAGAPARVIRRGIAWGEGNSDYGTTSLLA